MTPWVRGAFHARGPRLLFGCTHEDSAIELRAFRPGSRVFCIAGAGDTALALAHAGHDVTAVDINPCQVAYARARSEGAPERRGAAERLTGVARAVLPAIGCTWRRRREFLMLEDPAAQLAWYRRYLDGPLRRVLMDAALSRGVLRLAYRGPFLRALPQQFGACLRARLERGFGTHANRTNPHAWRLLIGQAPDALNPPRTAPVRVHCADAAAFLETSPPCSFDAFTLSNITDGAPPSYAARLCDAVRYAAAPGAIVVARSFGEPDGSRPNLAAEDRSLIWGSVTVETL
jgi:S-adenosylmethionine:diacylglycerol 3-amino-3-carboxypropyl transferase